MVPYIVSADIKLLLADWTRTRGFAMPSDEFFVTLRLEFCNMMRSIFPHFVFIPEDELVRGLDELAVACDVPLVSIDKAYHRTPLTLDITRLCKGPNNGAPVVDARHGNPPLDKQIEAIRAQSADIALLDDVIFSGDQTLAIADRLGRYGVRIKTVIAGIGIGEGVDRIRKLGIDVRCVRQFDEAVDEVCERDFYPGVPYCGRSLAGADNVGIPYILPFGKPADWASIPSGKAAAFSEFCLVQTIKLYRAIDEASDRQTRCCDLERQIYGVKNDDQPVVDALLAALKPRKQELTCEPD
jgi:hypothetical protein